MRMNPDELMRERHTCLESSKNRDRDRDRDRDRESMTHKYRTMRGMF